MLETNIIAEEVSLFMKCKAKHEMQGKTWNARLCEMIISNVNEFPRIKCCHKFFSDQSAVQDKFFQWPFVYISVLQSLPDASKQII